MKLLEIEWDAPGGAAEVEYDYPDQPIREFVNWLRRTSAWKESAELVERRLMKLNRELADYRNTPKPAPILEGVVVLGTSLRAEATLTTKEKRQAAMAKARAAKVAKRAAAAGG